MFPLALLRAPSMATRTRDHLPSPSCLGPRASIRAHHAAKTHNLELEFRRRRTPEVRVRIIGNGIPTPASQHAGRMHVLTDRVIAKFDRGSPAFRIGERGE